MFKKGLLPIGNQEIDALILGLMPRNLFWELIQKLTSSANSGLPQEVKLEKWRKVLKKSKILGFKNKI